MNWVKVLYSNISSCISNYGWNSEYFSLTRGIRQGCPLSALLFIIASEVLATNIRTDNQVKGIKVNLRGRLKELKIVQLADDATLFLDSENSIKHALKQIEKFSNVAGPKLNLSKTEGLWIGNLRNCNRNVSNIKWPLEPIKALGVYFGHNKELCDSLNWDQKIDDLDKTLRKWQARHLTLYGKILVIKTFALSKLIYLASSIYVPDWVTKRVTSIIYSSLWDGKKDKIKRKQSLVNILMEALK